MKPIIEIVGLGLTLLIMLGTLVLGWWTLEWLLGLLP